MKVKATYIFEFEPDTSAVKENKELFSKEVTKGELTYMLNQRQITADDFDYEVIDDHNDHDITKISKPIEGKVCIHSNIDKD